MLVRVELGHDPGAHGGPDRRRARNRVRAPARRCWWRRNDRPPTAPRARRYDYLIVGAGFAGSVLAERLASQHGARVLLIDRRPHVGGNAYDEPNEAGHPLSQIRAAHLPHQQRRRSSTICRNSPSGGPTSTACCALVRGQLVPIPINRTTLNMLFDLDLRPTRRRPTISPRAPSRSTRSRRRRTSSSTPSGASSTSCSSRAIRASNGASTRASSTSR